MARFFTSLITFLFFLLTFFKKVQSIDIYVSSIAQNNGNGTNLNPYSSLVSALNASYSDTTLIIHIMSNNNSYVVNSELNVALNLEVIYEQGGTNAIMDFSNQGSINVIGAYSVVIKNMQITQTYANYQPIVSAINLANLVQLNLTVNYKKTISYLSLI